MGRDRHEALPSGLNMTAVPQSTGNTATRLPSRARPRRPVVVPDRNPLAIRADGDKPAVRKRPDANRSLAAHDQGMSTAGQSHRLAFIVHRDCRSTLHRKSTRGTDAKLSGD